MAGSRSLSLFICLSTSQIPVITVCWTLAHISSIILLLKEEWKCNTLYSHDFSIYLCAFIYLYLFIFFPVRLSSYVGNEVLWMFLSCFFLLLPIYVENMDLRWKRLIDFSYSCFSSCNISSSPITADLVALISQEWGFSPYITLSPPPPRLLLGVGDFNFEKEGYFSIFPHYYCLTLRKTVL